MNPAGSRERFLRRNCSPGPPPEGWEPIPNTIALDHPELTYQLHINHLCYAWNQVLIDIEGRRARYYILDDGPDGPAVRAYWSPPGELPAYHPTMKRLRELTEYWGIPNHPVLQAYVADRRAGDVKRRRGRPPVRGMRRRLEMYTDAETDEPTLPGRDALIRRYYQYVRIRCGRSKEPGPPWDNALALTAEMFGFGDEPLGKDSLRKILHSAE